MTPLEIGIAAVVVFIFFVIWQMYSNTPSNGQNSMYSQPQLGSIPNGIVPGRCSNGKACGDGLECANGGPCSMSGKWCYYGYKPCDTASECPAGLCFPRNEGTHQP